jgi:hypothetical protein
MPPTAAIGTIQVRRRLAIVDPAYLHHWAAEAAGAPPTLERWRRIVLGSLVTVPSDLYRVLAVRLEGDAVVDTRVQRILITPKGRDLGDVIEEKGQSAVCVDGGQVAIFDMGDLGAVLRSSSDHGWAPAVLSPSGYGDGMYGVYLRKHASGRSVEIDFGVALDDDADGGP